MVIYSAHIAGGTWKNQESCRIWLKMADNKKHPFYKLLLLTLFCAAVQDVIGSRVQIALGNHLTANFKSSWKRLLIGSVAPVCSYNECRWCKYKCRAEQVPVDANDPINTAYHYKCVCRRVEIRCNCPDSKKMLTWIFA